MGPRRAERTAAERAATVQLTAEQATTDELLTDIAQADDTYPHPQVPPKVVRKPVVWPPKINWATRNMSAEDKAEHARISAFLKSRGVNLVYWNMYSLEKLYAMEKQLFVEGRVDF